MTTERVPFDERFLDLSYDWLQDPEIARLTRVPRFDREEQQRWWRELPDRTDYAIWGILHDGEPVGALGLKDIGAESGAEYFMYIGEPQHWGKGIARWAFDEIVRAAKSRGLLYLYGEVGKDNPRSLAVDLRHGFRIVEERPTSHWITFDLF